MLQQQKEKFLGYVNVRTEEKALVKSIRASLQRNLTYYNAPYTARKEFRYTFSTLSLIINLYY